MPFASSHPGFPVTNAIPYHGAGGGDSYGLDQFKVAVIKQIPGNDADEDANAFGYRECCSGRRHGVQSRVIPRRAVEGLAHEAWLSRWLVWLN